MAHGDQLALWDGRKVYVQESRDGLRVAWKVAPVSHGSKDNNRNYVREKKPGRESLDYRSSGIPQPPGTCAVQLVTGWMVIPVIQRPSLMTTMILAFPFM